MKTFITLTLIVVSFLTYAGNNQLKIGDKAPHTTVKMICVSGKTFSINDLKLDNGIAVIFSSNTCPFVMQWQNRYNEIKRWAAEHQVGLAVLNSNYKNRTGVDSYEAMQAHAKKFDYQFPYLVDKESLIANAMGGQTTPHVFLFNKDMKLVYKGAIDDNYENASEVKNAYLMNAIEHLHSGNKITPSETTPIGCSIKRKTP